MLMMITLAEYARRLDKNPAVVRQKVLRGKLPAVKSGGTWLIDEDQPYEDHRTRKFYRESEYYKRRLENARKKEQDKKAEKQV